MWDFNALAVLFGAVVLDFGIGDPRNLPHFVNYVAWCSNRLEKLLWKAGPSGFIRGVLFYFFVVVTSLFPCALLWICMGMISKLLASIVGVLLVFQSIAYRDLIRHVERILKPLEIGDLITAREKLSWVVGRDTDSLDEHEIARASIETLAESMNDGVIAPLFWAMVFGPLGAILFRVTNTLDSMVGHRDERYEWFGKVSARMDDVMGFLPARMLGCVLYFIGGGKTSRFTVFIQDAKQHSSWNAGYPEAAMAQVSGIKLGGTNAYEGVIHEGPVFNPKGDVPSTSHIKAALKLAKRTYFTSLVAGFLFLLLMILVS